MHGEHAIVPATLKWAEAINGIASPPAVWIQIYAYHLFRQIKLSPRSSWVKPPVCMYSPERNPWDFVFVLTHFKVGTLKGRELRAPPFQSLTQTRDSLRFSQMDKSYLSSSLLDLEKFLRWRLCDLWAACPTDFLRGNFFTHIHAEALVFQLAPVFSFPTVTSLPLLDGLPVGNSGAPQSHLLLGLSRACGWWLFAEVSHTVQTALPWASSTLCKAICTGHAENCRWCLNKCWGEGIITSLDHWLGSCSCSLQGCLPAPLLPGWRAGLCSAHCLPGPLPLLRELFPSQADPCPCWEFWLLWQETEHKQRIVPALACYMCWKMSLSSGILMKMIIFSEQ